MVLIPRHVIEACVPSQPPIVTGMVDEYNRHSLDNLDVASIVATWSPMSAARSYTDQRSQIPLSPYVTFLHHPFR